MGARWWLERGPTPDYVSREIVMHSMGRQKGAVIVTVAFALLFLLGFMAIALDFGHMFVVKDELQTSMDSCALSAAQELDGAGNAMDRAKSAGQTAGNLNNVNFQSGTWSGKGKIVPAEITFKDAAYVVIAEPANATAQAGARYAQCQHSQNGIQMWLFQSMGAFAGSTDPAYSSTKSVGALAVAARASAQSTCPIPIGLHPKPGGTAPYYGFQPGEWVTLLAKGISGPGQIGWYPLNSGGSTPDIIAQLNGSNCGVKVNDPLGLEAPGVKSAIDKVWNYRFGIYKNGDPGPSVGPPPDNHHPDYSGYAYTSTNWKPRPGVPPLPPPDAFAGTTPAGSHATAANFKTKRQAFASYDDTGTSVNSGDAITGLNLKGGFKTLATPGVAASCPDAAHEHMCYGFDRRIVLVPVVVAGGVTVKDFACMLMLQPMTDPNANVQLEFIEIGGAVNSPCTTNGYAGGTAGPKVPVLVQ